MDPADGWMKASPTAAALLAGLLAAVVRATTTGGPRPLHLVLIDGIGTVALGWLLFHVTLGAGWSYDTAFGCAGLLAALGWEVVRRMVLRAASPSK